MPGDIIHIDDSHIQRAEAIFPFILDAFTNAGKEKFVVSVYGGSGVGKSEIGTLIARSFISRGVGVYLMSGDNYPRRIPEYNDNERKGRYRYGGLRALAVDPGFKNEWSSILMKAWEEDRDAAPALADEFPFIEIYQNEGRRALESYLGTDEEIDFPLVNEIISKFKNGDQEIAFKRMGRVQQDIFFETVDCSKKQILIIEWSHGNNSNLKGIDFPVFLFSNPKETLNYRLKRSRDKGADSPFVTMVLDVEQNSINSQVDKAALIISKSGVLLTPEEVKKKNDK